MTKIKLIASDLDGTLLPYGTTELGPEVCGLIKQLNEQGIRFAPASGRQLDNLRLLFEPVKDEITYVCQNGAGAVADGKRLCFFPMEEALEMTGKVLSDREAAEKVNAIRGSLSEGKSFSDAVSDTGLFDELHSSMIRMGSATGHEDQVLGKLSVLYEEQVEDEISRLISIIEPTLACALGFRCQSDCRGACPRRDGSCARCGAQCRRHLLCGGRRLSGFRRLSARALPPCL